MSVIDLSERESRIVNIVKAKYRLKRKSQTLSLILRLYEECELEPQLWPEFVKEIQEAKEHGKFVKITDFAEDSKPSD